jgi:hypothetical protein
LLYWVRMRGKAALSHERDINRGRSQTRTSYICASRWDALAVDEVSVKHRINVSLYKSVPCDWVGVWVFPVYRRVTPACWKTRGAPESTEGSQGATGSQDQGGLALCYDVIKPTVSGEYANKVYNLSLKQCCANSYS